MSVIEAKNLSKTYGFNADNKTTAVRDISLDIENGEFVAIMGPSGSGKSTLINMLSGILAPSAGEVVIDGVSLADMDKQDMAQFRREKLGFVFQDFNLLDNLTVKENIILPMVFDKKDKNTMEEVAANYMAKFGIEKIANKYPYEISGGQMQRTAVARSLVNNPVTVFADEPTGNLDSKSSNAVMECFENINQNGTTVLMVTHDVFAASFCKHVIFIKDGKINMDIYRKGTRQQFFEQILECQAIVGGDSYDL
ncbi:MAG: ABC transporter ATP-binding protein [Lachnospiraceae bacterium]|nr:ABC transporter ATP-binding protein [Lachnospiraceae bacterium]